MTATFRNGNLFCDKCGTEYKLDVPCPIDKMTKTMSVFEQVHKDCDQTWEEPKANQAESVQQRAWWWFNGGGERGMSSETMWNCFMGNPGFSVNHPYDPDDFKRCYKLLEAIPEWKERLPELKPLSEAWSNLVDNWDRLTERYERMVKGDEETGMYDFMQTLIR